MRIRRGWILCLAVTLSAVWVATPAPGETKWDGHRHVATGCVVKDTSWGSMVTAQTTWMIWSQHASPDAYRWRARLIPEHPGLNFLRSWNEQQVEVTDVQPTGASSYYATVSTPPMSASLDWDLQVKLTWDRANERDHNVEYVLDFNEANCAAG
jgi:hypothetical protein